MHIGTSIGDIAGPMFNILSKSIVDFSIGPIRFTYVNAPMLPIILLICFQITVFSVHLYLLNAERDSVKVECREEENKLVFINVCNSSLINDLRIIFKKEVVLIIALSGYCGFNYSLYYQIVPLIMKYLHYGDMATNWYMLGCTSASFGSILLMSHVKLTKKESVMSGITILITTIMVNIGYFILSKSLEVYFNAVVLVISALSLASFFTGLSTFPITMLQKLIDPKHRTFVESIRMSVDIFCRMVAALLTAPIYEYLFYFSFLNLCLSVLFVIFILKWRRAFLL